MLNHLIQSNLTLGYLDAGTGSLVLQSIVAGALTLGFTVKSKWALIKSKLNNKKSV